MNNILKIITSDIKRLSSNVVAVVVIIGLSVIPCLYAWFNIMSNWDPYGPDATKNLQVAVANADQGMVIAGKEINIGDKIISNLKENNTIGWVFTDTTYEAVQGVHAGDYYAALVIDESFSRDMVSFLGGNIENPTITYYENDKKNAIAPKITGKVKNTLQQQIDKAFVSTLAGVILEASDSVIAANAEGNLTGAAVEKLETLNGDLTAVVLILESYISLMESNENLMEAGSAVSDQIDALVDSASVMADSAKTASESMTTVVNSTSVITIEGLRQISSKLGDVSDAVDEMVDWLLNQTGNLANDAEMVETMTKAEYIAWMVRRDALTLPGQNNVDVFKNEIDNDFARLLGSDFIEYYAKNHDAGYALTNGEIKELKDSTNNSIDETRLVKAKVKTTVANCQAAINSVIDEYANSVQPQMDSTKKTVGDSLKEVEKLLNYKPSSINAVVATLGSYPNMMDQSKESLIEARDEALAMQSKLQTIIDKMEELETNEQYEKVVDLLENDPDALAEFISSPVKVSEEYMYEMENNGSAASPFYIVLSIWVGSLIMSTILKTTVKDTSELKDVKNWQCFFARYWATFVIGQIQTIITVLGALLYVGIQCEHPFLLWLACSWTATVFSFLLYSFTYSFGNLGEALSVILMVIQVAGAGGTFPIEVLPKVFQYLYKFMPFNYSMNALRECVGGFYKYRYWQYLAVLLVYVAIAVVNGVLLYYPCLRLNEQIEKSKEKSGILI